jgi:hypothetical protein
MQRNSIGNDTVKFSIELNGSVAGTYRIAPETIPDTPIPEIARPTIKQLDVGATPASKDPISNTQIADRKQALVVSTLYILPQNN